MADASLYNATETPVLISNIEVLEMLQKQQKQRQQQEAAAQSKGGEQHGDNGGDGGDGKSGRAQAKKHRRTRHRDWIEEQVMQYIQSTPCMQIANSTRHQRNKLEKKLTSAPKKKSSIISSEATTFNIAAESANPGTLTTTGSTGQQQGGYGLMPAEALQILNFMPTCLVEIHLIIEELNERMTEKQQEDFLKFMSDTIASFQNNKQHQHSTTAATSTVPTPPTTTSTSLASTATTNDMAMEMEMADATAEAMTAPVLMVKQEPT